MLSIAISPDEHVRNRSWEIWLSGRSAVTQLCQLGGDCAQGPLLAGLRVLPRQPPGLGDHHDWHGFAPLTAAIFGLPPLAGVAQLGNQVGLFELADRAQDLSDHLGGGCRIGEVGWCIHWDQLDPALTQQRMAGELNK